MSNADVKKWLKKDGEKFLKNIGIKEGQIILDFGCGEGHYTIPIAKAVGEKGKVYAFDKDKEALNKLNRMINGTNIKNIEVINANSKVPLQDNSIDVVLCYDIIHYLKDRSVIYNEVYRVLREKGFFSVYPKHHKKDYPLQELADTELNDIISEIKRSGFILEHKFFKRLFHDDYYNKGYILNFRKKLVKLRNLE